jgi:hypothetical protein
MKLEDINPEDLTAEAVQTLYGFHYGITAKEDANQIRIDTAKGTLGVDVSRPLKLKDLETAISLLRDMALRAA